MNWRPPKAAPQLWHARALAAWEAFGIDANQRRKRLKEMQEKNMKRFVQPTKKGK